MKHLIALIVVVMWGCQETQNNRRIVHTEHNVSVTAKKSKPSSWMERFGKLDAQKIKQESRLEYEKREAKKAFKRTADKQVVPPPSTTTIDLR